MILGILSSAVIADTPPTKVSENFSTLDTYSASGTGTFTMNKTMKNGTVVSISFVNSGTHDTVGIVGGSITGTGTGTNAILTCPYTAPDSSNGDLQIKFVAQDSAGTPSAITYSNSYTLF